MAFAAPAETLLSYSPKTPTTYDERFRPTYTFEEQPCPWRVSKMRRFDSTPRYTLGWLIRLDPFFDRTPPDFDRWSESVVLPRWIELGFENDENVRDMIYPPRMKIYGNHHVVLEIGTNLWETVSSMKRPEVRERMLQQAWASFDLNPKHAKVEKLRWFRYPAPRDTGRRPVTYPAIYKEEIHVLPDWYMELMDGSWLKKHRPELFSKTLSDSEREDEDGSELDADESPDVSDCSWSTTDIGQSNL
ncbi:hypothetical protein MD484_g4142, partial [Candolleomyces efflorescens]